MNILFFSPYSYFDVHAVPELIVANSIYHKKNRVIRAYCNGLFKNYCLAMTGVDFNDIDKKKDICKICKQNNKQIIKKTEIENISIDDFCDEKDKLLIDRILNNINFDDIINFEFENVPIGRFSLYEFLLTYKLSSLNVPIEKVNEAIEHLRNSLYTCIAIEKIISRYKLDRFVTYNMLYSTNRTAQHVCERNQIPSFTLHAGYHSNRGKMLQLMTIFKGINPAARIHKNEMVRKYRESPIPQKKFETLKLNCREYILAKSPWVYSIATKKINSCLLKQKLGIQEGQKVVLAVMRSEDEIFAAETSGVYIDKSIGLFSNQKQWAVWLNEFARKNPSFFVIFRLHPREFPNKREKILSQNAKDWAEFHAGFHSSSNFFVNVPEHNLALSDIFKVADLVLNNSSSAGLEANLFGIPVLGYGQNLAPFDSYLQLEPTSIEEYEYLIRKLSFESWRFERVIYAMRWLNYLISEVSIDISDVYINLNFDSSVFMRLTNKIKRLLFKFLHISSPSLVINSRLPREIEKLSFAILYNEESHIGFFKAEIGDERAEYDFIRKDLLERAALISDADDLDFLKRIDLCLKN